MKVLLTFPISAASGKVGGDNGQVLMRSRGRNLSRSYVKPNNPNTQFQQFVRQFFALASAEYRTTTKPQRAAWASLSEQFKRNDVLGQAIKQFTNNAYYLVNWYRWLQGNDFTNTPPAFAIPETPSWPTPSMGIESGTDLLFTINATTGTGGWWQIRATGNLGFATRNARANEFRYITTIEASALVAKVVVGGQQTITFDLSAVRFPYANGQFAGVEITPISSTYIPGVPLIITNLPIESV